MKQTINSSQFNDAFERMGRKDQFTYAGKEALYNYLEECSEDSGVEYDLDVIDLCCDFTEYANLTDLQVDYPHIESMDDLRDHTTVIEVGHESFIIQDY